MIQVTVGRRYTIVIPRIIRERLGIREGQRLAMWVEGNRIVLEPLAADPFKVLAEVVDEPYSEELEEQRVEALLRKFAGR